MAVSYRVDGEHSLIRIELSDPFDQAQIAEVVRRFLADPEIRPGMSILSDHSNLKFTATTAMAKSIPGFLERLGEHLGAFRCAVVTPGDASYGMARMTEVLADTSSGTIRAFRSLDEAEVWLGVSRD